MKQVRLVLDRDLIVDNFAGGGGASTGIEAAIGRAVDIAINHDPEAVAMHAANHPFTHHYCEDVFAIDPVEVTQGQPVQLAWFSPDCKHFSKAKGGKPVSKKIRGLAWIVIKWAKTVRPKVIMLENVEEFETWGPLTKDGMPDPAKKGLTFRRWWRQLENAGYTVDWRVLKACDYGAPTIRKRLFVIARCDGQPIVWPKPTHGPGLLPYRTAAECIDFSIPCPSIFERKKPLAENTLKRIAKGLKRYVIDSADPFIVPMQHDNRPCGIDEPLQTVTTQTNKFGLVTPYIARIAQTGGNGSYTNDARDPLTTVTSKAEHLLVTPVLAQANDAEERIQLSCNCGHVSVIGSLDEPCEACGEKASGHITYLAPFLVGAGGPTYSGKPKSVDEPLNTQPTENHTALIAPTLVQVGYGEREGQAPRALDIEAPLGTVVGSTKHALVSAFMVKHYGDQFTGRKASEVTEPMPTSTARGTQVQLVTSNLVKLRGDNVGQSVEEPLATVSAQGTHHAEVRAFLLKYYGTDQDPKLNEPLHTVTTKERFGLVTIHGVDYQIVDIGMRMLTPRELYLAQGFPADYVIDFTHDGKPLTKTAQVRMCGNSVSPPVATALVKANIVAQAKKRKAA